MISNFVDIPPIGMNGKDAETKNNKHLSKNDINILTFNAISATLIPKGGRT